jgi:predicted acetyltransferase
VSEAEPTRVELVAARPADAARLERLLQLYLHDFSEILGEPPDDDGRFAYPHLAAYWEDPGRVPLLILSDGRLAGFVLLASGSRLTEDEAVTDVAEFFVVRGLRRRGVGLVAARLAFACRAGPFEVRVMERNAGAAAFWRRAVAGFTAGRFRTSRWVAPSGRPFEVFHFESPGPEG